LKLTILGSGGSAVSAKRACPCFAIDGKTLFDLGPGALKNLRSSGLKTDDLSRIFISHPHADHISDLIPLLWAVQIDGRQTPLEVYGPPGFKEVFRSLLKCTGTADGFFKFPLSVHEIEFGSKLDNITTCLTSHSIPTLAFRIDSERTSFCYSADTIYCPRVVELARDVDLLLHEATFLDDQLSIAELTYHSTAQMAGRVAKGAEAKRLLLFHIPPPNENREVDFFKQSSAAYESEVSIANDMTSIEF
jgi:ribonuclease BN (tRNA processing enzyme)